MKKLSFLVGALLMSSCTTHKGFVDYQSLGVWASGNAGNLKFQDVGPISADASSFVWKSCDSVATEAVRNLIDIAKTRGGNTVYNITFESESARVSTPTCYKQWLWLATYVGILGPWVTRASADGIAAKIADQSEKTSGIYLREGVGSEVLAAEYVSKVRASQH